MNVTKERPPADTADAGWVRSLWRLQVLDLPIFGILAAAEALSVLLLRSLHAGFFLALRCLYTLAVPWSRRSALAPYEGRKIVLDIRPEHICFVQEQGEDIWKSGI